MSTTLHPELRGLPVTTNGIELARTVEVLVDGDGELVGFELACRDGTRRFRTVYVEVPRKNAKSTLTSGVGLYMLALDGEGGAECYSAATTRDRSRVCVAMSA